MNTRRMLSLCIVLMLSGACASLKYPPIENVSNPEDILAIDHSDWALVSSMPGAKIKGNILAINAKTGQKQTLYPGPAAAMHAFPESNCQTEVPASDFAPHGIALSTNGEGQQILHVVNHGSRESIEHFTLELASTPTLHWRGCTPLPEGAYANAVAATATGTLYVSNMRKTGSRSSTDAFSGIGEVLVWRAEHGWLSLPDSDVPGANGILFNPDSQQIYVASWTKGEIIELSLDANKTARRVLTLDFLPDNIRWTSSGLILAAGFESSVESVVQCVTSTLTRCPVPSRIALIDPKTFTVRCEVLSEQGLSTVATPVKDQIWIGTARGDRIYRISKDDMTAPACR